MCIDSFWAGFVGQVSLARVANRKSQKMFLFIKIVENIEVYAIPKPCTNTVKILKIGTPQIITIIVLLMEQLDFTVQCCVQKMQTE